MYRGIAALRYMKIRPEGELMILYFSKKKHSKRLLRQHVLEIQGLTTQYLESPASITGKMITHILYLIM